MRKLLNISTVSVRLAVTAYILVNIIAFFFASSSVGDSQHFSLSTKSLKGDCSFFVCDENEKDGEEDDYETQSFLKNISAIQTYSHEKCEPIASSNFSSISDSSEIYLYNCSFLI
jgi:hypothetical protein